MKVLVLGATGLAGQAMIRAAAARGHAVRAAARKAAPLAVDIADETSLLDLVAAEAPELIVNCAGLVDIDACERDPWLGWRTNARPLSYLAGWSNATGGRLVHISTDHYFPTGGAAPHDEDAPIAFANDYARQKFAGEAFALTAAKALVLRTSIVGLRRRGPPTFAEWAIDLVEHDKPATLFADAYTSSIDVWTFAAAAFDLVERGSSGLLNLAAGEVYSKEAFIREIARQAGRSLTAAQRGSVRSLKVQRANCLGLDVRRAEALLGYPLPRLRDVVASLVRHHREGLA